MKAKKLAALLLTLVLALGLIPMGAMAAQTTVTPTSTASITVNNAVANDVFAAYKVIDITYTAGDNNLTKDWNTNFAGYFTGTTVEQFAALKNDPEQLKTLLAGLPKYIEDNHIDPVQTKAATGTPATATFADLDMGEYFIRPTSTTSVYQLMLQKIEPTVANVGGVQTYVIDDVTFNAKHKEVNVTKTADKTSVTKNEKVTYTVTVDIPTYLDDVAIDKTFYVSDLLPDGLTIDTNSIEVKINGAAVDAGAYTLNTTAIADTFTFKLSVSNEQYTNYWKANAGKQLVIKYTATLNDNDTTAVNTKETNKVTFDYSNYPYVASHVTKTASVDVTTFAIKVDKHEKDHNETKLANAKFDLYRTLYEGETSNVTIPHTDVQGVKLESGVTDAYGAITFAKYEANGAKYDYYLVETQAPSGYNLLTNAVKVNFADADVAGTAGVYTVDVENSSGIQLPITGGTGTVIFTIIGIALMVGAVVLFVVSRKKAKESK